MKPPQQKASIYSALLAIFIGSICSTPQAHASDLAAILASGNDPCADPVIQAELIAQYNDRKSRVVPGGQIVAVKDLHNSLPGTILCEGTYTFTDGSSKLMSVEYLNDRSEMAMAHGIPGHCNLQDTVDRIRSYVPGVLKIQGGTPSIQSVDILSDEGRIVYSVSSNRADVLHMLQCPTRLTWSDGHEQLGYYTEWEDHQYQVRFDFTARAIRPH